jgi:DNA-binding NtrC family response regulator
MNTALHRSICEVASMFARRPTILLIEDEPKIVTYLQRVLASFEVDFETAENRATVEIALEGGPYDMVILDLVVPDISRTDLLRLVAEKTCCPVMVLSGNIDGHIQQSAISILDRPIWFVEKPTVFTPEGFERVFRMFNLAAGRHR